MQSIALICLIFSNSTEQLNTKSALVLKYRASFAQESR